MVDEQSIYDRSIIHTCEMRCGRLDTTSIQTSTLVVDWNGTVMDDTERARISTNVVLARSGINELSMREFRRRFVLPLGTFFASIGVHANQLVWAEATWNTEMQLRPAIPTGGVIELLRPAPNAQSPSA